MLEVIRYKVNLGRMYYAKTDNCHRHVEGQENVSIHNHVQYEKI